MLPFYDRLGIATVYGARSICPQPSGGHVRLMPGCFDDSLRQHAVGSTTSRFWSIVVASATTAGRAFSLWGTPRAVYVGFRSAEMLAILDRHAHLPAMSPGWVVLESRPNRDHLGPVTDIIKAKLVEVSLVDISAFPGSFHNF